MKPDNTSISQVTFRFFVLVAVSIILILFDSLGILRPFRGFLELPIVPIKRSINEWVTGGGGVLDIIINFQKVKKNQEQLGSLEKNYEAQKIELQKVKLENESLRKQLEAPLPPSLKFVPAPVLGISRYMLIEGGEDEGIRKGMSVVDGTIFIGRVVSTTTHTASVILLSDPSSSIPSISSRGTRGKVVGEFGEKVFFDKVLQKDELFLEDSVVTSGEEGVVPGLLIGKVGRIEAKDFEVYKRGELISAIKYNRETTVFVITGM